MTKQEIIDMVYKDWGGASGIADSIARYVSLSYDEGIRNCLAVVKDMPPPILVERDGPLILGYFETAKNAIINHIRRKIR